MYAHREELPLHSVAVTKLTELAEADAPWGIPIFCVGEFVRVVTHPKLFHPPYTASEACKALDRLLESPSLRLLRPGQAFMSLFSDAIHEANAIGNLVFDAQIVAVCREFGVSCLLTEDRDFARFPRFPFQTL